VRQFDDTPLSELPPLDQVAGSPTSTPRTILGPRLGLPVRPFFYTIDQVAAILDIDIVKINQYVAFQGIAGSNHTEGRKAASRRRKMMAVTIQPSVIQEPEWRVPESELLSYMEERGLRFVEIEATARSGGR